MSRSALDLEGAAESLVALMASEAAAALPAAARSESEQRVGDELTGIPVPARLREECPRSGPRLVSRRAQRL